MDDKDKKAKNNRGWAKAALIKISNFINADKQLFKKHDLINKLQKIESIYLHFDKTDAELPPEISEMGNFEKNITKPK